MKTLIKFLKDESGQSTTEYVLLLVMVIFAVRQLQSIFGPRLQNLVTNAFNQADGALQNGGGP